jgi:Acetyl-CoA carboxylase alpha subunit
VSDGTIKEPAGGAHHDKSFVFNKTDEVLQNALAELTPMDGNALVDQRYDKYMSIGQFSE